MTEEPKIKKLLSCEQNKMKKGERSQLGILRVMMETPSE